MPSGTVGPGLDNGFNGEFSGFEIQTSANLGTAVVQGWELSYQQQFTFLPGLLRGLGLSVNYTYLKTHGDFGGPTTRSTDEVPDFIPRTGNVSLSWRYGKFGARVNVNYTDGYLDALNAANAPLNLYRVERTIVNAGVAYRFRPALSFSIDVGNLFNEHQAFYRGYPDRMQSTIIPGTTITFGVSGRF